MQPEQYTEDAVCFAMGLGQFAPTGSEEVVRLVYRPSFHPEVCVTLTSDAIVTVALRSMLWPEPVPARLPELSERAALPASELADVGAAFDRALAESKQPPKWVVIADGMAVSALRARAGRLERYAGHAVNEEERRLAIGVLSLALSNARSVELRNRISWCGRYLSSRDDRAFPVEPESPQPQPQVSRLLVLGTPEERAELHASFGTKPASGQKSGRG